MADPNTDLELEFLPFVRIYKDGRIERLQGTDTVPASVDPATGVASKDVVIDPAAGVSARIYLPPESSNKKKLPILVYYHGGGFIIQSAFNSLYHRHLNLLSSQAGVLAVSVDYRLAPEHPLPAAYDDSWAALRWVFASGDTWLSEHGDLGRVFLAGDSAGANIAHHMAARAGAAPGMELEGAVLVHPFFWGSEPMGKETRDPAMRAWVESIWRFASPGTEGADDPLINPAVAAVGCRRVVVCVAGEDVLKERGKAYYEAARARERESVEAELVESEGEGHVFHLDSPTCEKALSLMEHVVAFLNK